MAMDCSINTLELRQQYVVGMEFPLWKQAFVNKRSAINMLIIINNLVNV